MDSSLKKYRSKIKTEIIQNRALAELILNRKISEDDFDSDVRTELNDHVFSFAYIPEFQGQPKTFLTFELSGRATGNTGLYKDMSLYFFIFTHHSLINPKSTHGQYVQYLRTDLMDEEIVDMFNENLNFGCGKMRCFTDDFLRVNNDYYGRQLKFGVSDLAKKVC